MLMHYQGNPSGCPPTQRLPIRSRLLSRKTRGAVKGKMRPGPIRAWSVLPSHWPL